MLAMRWINQNSVHLSVAVGLECDADWKLCDKKIQETFRTETKFWKEPRFRRTKAEGKKCGRRMGEIGSTRNRDCGKQERVSEPIQFQKELRLNCGATFLAVERF